MQSRAKVTTQCLYRNLCTAYRLVTNLETRVNFRHTFLGSNIFPQRIFRTVLLSERDEILQRWGLANRNVFPEFHERWSGGAATCISPSLVHL